MKIRCERDVLVDALATAARAASSRNTGLSSIMGILLQAKDDQLALTATDLDITIQVECHAVVATEGSCVVPAKLTTDIAKALPVGAISLESSDDEVRLSCAKSQFSVRTLDVEEFPKTTKTAAFTATLDVDEFNDALRQVVRGASNDDARPVLTGVLFSAEADGLRMVATDSYRLAVRDLKGNRILQTDQSLLVPSRALTELGRMLDGENEVHVALEENEITFATTTTQLRSRLIEGQFPDYKPLIPSAYPNRLTIDRDLLLEAVRRVKLLVRDATTPVRIALRPDSVELTVVSQEVGQATEEVEAKYEGEGMTVAFNPSYLIDGLEAVSGGNVLIETLDALKPATIKAAESPEFLYLIMPVRVS